MYTFAPGFSLPDERAMELMERCSKQVTLSAYFKVIREYFPGISLNDAAEVRKHLIGK